MSGPVIIIEILWIFIWLTLCLEYLDALQSTDKQGCFIALLIFLIGAPFFLITNVLEVALDMIFPEGWDDDSGGGFNGW